MLQEQGKEAESRARPQSLPTCATTHNLSLDGRPELLHLRALGRMDLPPIGAFADGPEPDELTDFGSALLPGEWAFRPSGPFVADGDQSALGVAAVPWGLLSLGFPRVPFLFLSGVRRGPGVERRPPKRGIYAGQRPAALVGVTGFEPAASPSRTTSKVVANRR